MGNMKTLMITIVVVVAFNAVESAVASAYATAASQAYPTVASQSPEYATVASQRPVYIVATRQLPPTYTGFRPRFVQIFNVAPEIIKKLTGLSILSGILNHGITINLLNSGPIPKS